MTPKIWAKYAWVFHLVGMAFISGVAWAGVSSQSMRIDKIEEEIKGMPAALARIEQKVDDIKGNNE